MGEANFYYFTCLNCLRVSVRVRFVLFVYPFSLKSSKCVKSFIFKPASVVTRSEPNFGRLSPTNTESTQPALTMETQTCNWRELTFITMKPPVANMFRALAWSTRNLERWTLSDPVRSDKSFGQTISYSVSRAPVTTGPKVITQKAPN